MRRGDEDHAPDEGQRHEEEASPQELPRFRRDVQTVDGNAEGLVPESLAAVDGVAENMLKLGLKPESTMKGFMALSTIEEAKNKEVTSEEAYEIILKDFKQLLDEVKSVKALAEKDNVYVTSNLMDDYIEMFYKANWMVGQVLKK